MFNSKSHCEEEFPAACEERAFCVMKNETQCSITAATQSSLPVKYQLFYL